MKETTLFNRHKDLGANFGEFGGYRMPLWYNSVKQEHLNVLKRVGLFDTSHMALFSISGNDAFSLLNRAFTRELNDIKKGRSVYGLFLNKNGHLIDDALIYIVSKDSFFIVVNAGMSEQVIKHLNSLGYKDYKIVNYVDQLGKIDIQGPKSLELLERLFGKELFDDFPYFSFKGSFLEGNIRFDGEPILISRSGYTGEFGFELFINNNYTGELWDTLLKQGEDIEVIPCGLAARDSLRVGANLPLSHQDIGDWPFNNTPWDFAISKNKKDFIGNNNLDHSSFTYPYVGFDVRKLREPAKGKVLYKDIEIGRVLSCITEPSLGDKGLVSGFILVNKKLDLSTLINLSDGKRDIKVKVVDKIRCNKTARKSISYIRSL